MHTWLKEEPNKAGKKNALKKVVYYKLGRKNFMFAGNHEATHDNAMIYSLFATCIQQDINPEEWLIFVLERIVDWPINRLVELLPQNFKTLQEAG